MSLAHVSLTNVKPIPAGQTQECEELVRRVASSSAIERSPRLRTFFLHVCRCALENKPEEATEQQIGIRVYERHPGYNPNEDNIVRSQARLLRMKLEHYFSNEGKDEPVVITIPKGRYLPVFERRSEEPPAVPAAPLEPQPESRRLVPILAGVAIVFALVILCLGYVLLKSKSAAPLALLSSTSLTRVEPAADTKSPNRPPIALLPGTDEIRIAAGHTGSPYKDAWGRRWLADQYFEGGIARSGPRHFFPPIADDGPFRTMREAIRSKSNMVPSQFRYNIPLHPGAYELRLYFADPLREPDADQVEDAQNRRLFQINLNGRPLVVNLDPIADAGTAAIDVRAFRDVSPAADGQLHLAFISSWADPAFLTALELTPGTPGKTRPIRLTAHRFASVDNRGIHWSADDYFIGGRTNLYANPDSGPKVPDLYTAERHGNFTYAIPVPPGSYTVKLHFMEAFFSPLVPAAYCRGTGCRVFDVTCNGVMLLEDFDISQAAAGAFRPLVREFHGLRPNGQGKLLLSFSPKVNYAEIRAIEVLDEAR